MKQSTYAVVVALVLMAAPVFGQVAVVAQGGTAGDEKQIVAQKMRVELAQQAKLSVIGKVTKGAPYTADTMNESVQVLADGNRIVSKTTSKVYRDSEGRTRMEQLGPDGPGTVSISDPVAGTTFMLNPASRSAYANNAVVVASGGTVGSAAAGGGWRTTTDEARFVWDKKAGEGNVAIATTVPSSAKATAEKKAAVEAQAAQSNFTYTLSSPNTAGGVFTYTVSRTPGDTTREDLGSQLVEGVAANGTRTTTVIPAGAIGNEQPIKIVSEEWFSSELGILVLTKHSDPRSGDTTYRVTNINRAEPDPALFQVPANYKVERSIIKRDDR